MKELKSNMNTCINIIDDITEYQKIYRQTHKDKKAIYNKTFRQKNAEYQKIYQQTHKEKIAIYNKRYREKKKSQSA